MIRACLLFKTYLPALRKTHDQNQNRPFFNIKIKNLFNNFTQTTRNYTMCWIAQKKKNLDIHMTRDQMPPKTILSCWFSKDFLKKNIWLFFSKIRQSKPTSNWTYTKRSVTFSCYLQGIVVLHTTPYLPIHRILLLTRKRIARTVNQ